MPLFCVVRWQWKLLARCTTAIQLQRRAGSLTSAGHGVQTVPMSYLIDVLLTTLLSTRFGKSPAGVEERTEFVCPIHSPTAVQKAAGFGSLLGF